MKFTQNFENLEQKETKLTKGFWFSRTLASFAIFCSILLCGTVFAQNAENIADREVQRRQAAIPAGEAALARGKSAMRSRNYTVAYQEFKTAIAYLPDAVVSGRAHDEAADGVCKSGTVLAEARIAQGDYAGAEAILNEILTRYDPNCRKAQELFAHMRQPGYFNKTVDAGFINKVEEVKRLLAEADGYYQSGQYRQGDEKLRPGAGARPVQHRRAQRPGTNRQHQISIRRRSVQRDARPAALESRGSLATTGQKIRRRRASR